SDARRQLNLVVRSLVQQRPPVHATGRELVKRAFSGGVGKPPQQLPVVDDGVHQRLGGRPGQLSQRVHPVASDAVDHRAGSRLGGGIGSGVDSQGEAAHGAALLFVASAPVVLREVVPAVVAKDAGQASQGDGG